MSLPKDFLAPSFRRHPTGRFMALIVGLMVFVAVFTLLAEASVASMGFVWHTRMQQRMTIELPARSDEATVSQVERVQQAIDIVRAMPGVARVQPVKEDEVMRLLHPWIADEALLKSLPVPALIDVEPADGATLDAANVERQLRTTLRDARVESHAGWLKDLQRLVQGMAAFGGLLVALILATLVLIVIMLCRSIMMAERETIGLLHIMGAEDNDIAAHFARHTRGLAMVPALAGGAVAIMFAATLLYLARHFADPALLMGVAGLVLLASAVALPVVAILLASLAARLTVVAQLRSLP